MLNVCTARLDSACQPWLGLALLSLMLMAVEVCLELCLCVCACVRVATMLQVHKTNAKLVATCAAFFSFLFLSFFIIFFVSTSCLRLSWRCPVQRGINNSSQQLSRFISCSLYLFSYFICVSLFLSLSLLFLFFNYNKQLLTQMQKRKQGIAQSRQNVIQTNSRVVCVNHNSTTKYPVCSKHSLM